MGHASLGVVEPLLDELLDRLHPVLGHELLESGLADAGRADHRQVVAVPLVGHPNPAPAHADDVRDVLVIALHPHRREDQPALLVDVAREGHVGRRIGVAAVGLMRLGGGGEDVLAIDEDRNEDDVVGRVGVAEVRIVVQERVALPDVVMQLGDGFGQELHANDVHRQPLGGGEEPVVAGDQRAREVARHVEHRRASRAQQRVFHLAHDGVETVGDDGEQDWIETHDAATSSRMPAAVRSAASAPISNR